MNRTKLSFIFFSFLFLAESKAQTTPTNYHYYNSFYYNPAMAGIDYKNQMTFTYGEERFEQKGFLSLEASSEKLKSGIGFFAKSHRDQSRETNNIGLAYNYTVHFSKLSRLTTGFQISHINISSKNEDDPNKTKELWQAQNVDIGIVFSFEELKIGASLFHILRPGVLWERDSFDFYIPQIFDHRLSNFSISYNAKVSKYLDFQIAFLYHLEWGKHTKERMVDLSAFMTIYKYVTIGGTHRDGNSSDDRFNKLFLGLRPTEKLLLNFSFDLKRSSKKVQYPAEFLAQYRF